LVSLPLDCDRKAKSNNGIEGFYLEKSPLISHVNGVLCRYIPLNNRKEGELGAITVILTAIKGDLMEFLE
jgi:hypothetical protein